MAKKSKVVSLSEVRLAQSFLRTISADWHDNGLIVGFVAWFHTALNKQLVRGSNNPFNIRPSNLDAAYRSGVTKPGLRRTAHYSTYSSVDKAVAALANVLLHGGGAGDVGFKLIVRAARSGIASEFLAAIAQSSWDDSHYGTDAKGHIGVDLYAAYNSYTGVALPPTPQPKQPKPPKPKPFHSEPKPLRPLSTFNTYINGFAIEKFYLARHPGIPGVDSRAKVG